MNLARKEGKITLHCLNVGYINFLSKNTVWKVLEVNLTMEEPDKHYLTQVTKVRIHSDKHVGRVYI